MKYITVTKLLTNYILVNLINVIQKQNENIELCVSYRLLQLNAIDYHITTRISIQTAGLAFGGTGLCSYRVRGVDGSCAKHLTVEHYTVIYAANSHTYY